MASQEGRPTGKNIQIQLMSTKHGLDSFQSHSKISTVNHYNINLEVQQKKKKVVAVLLPS